jgi:hypothetical protein
VSTPQQPRQPEQYGWYPQQPPGQYGYYPPPGHEYLPPGYPARGQYPPQRLRRGGAGILATAIVLGVLGAAALFLALLAGHAASTCSSGLGQLAQAFDQQTATNCSDVSLAHIALKVVTVVLGVGCLAAAIGYFRR